jgi:hypothetical protein
MLGFFIALYITFLDAYTQIAVNPSTTDASTSDRWGENLIMYDSSLLDINNIKVLIYLPGTNGINLSWNHFFPPLHYTIYFLN